MEFYIEDNDLFNDTEFAYGESIVEKSEIIFEGEKTCSLCQRAGREILNMKGLYFDKNYVVAEDIFNTKFLGVYAASQRFKNFIDENHFTNLSLIESEKYKPSWIK